MGDEAAEIGKPNLPLLSSLDFQRVPSPLTSHRLSRMLGS